MSEPILAADAERDMAPALLREASVDGRLTAPLVRIRHGGMIGSLSVRSRPRLTDEITAHMRRFP